MKKNIVMHRNQVLIFTTILSFTLIMTLHSCCNKCDDCTPPVTTLTPDFFMLGCPEMNDSITWTSFGNWSFNLCGDDDFAKNLITECKWNIYKNHNGGEGDVLEISSDTANSIVFCWSDNNFTSFLVKEGWLGQSEKGIIIGSKFSEFINMYPEFIKVNNNVWKNDSEVLPVLVRFSNDSLLQEIIVGRYFEY